MLRSAVREPALTPASFASEPVFGSILCGIDGGRASLEAARQAAILAGPATPLTYVAVTWEVGLGATHDAEAGNWRAREGLRRARDGARRGGLDPFVVEEESPNAAGRLMALAAGHDLLAIGINGRPRATDAMIGATAGAVVHQSPVPLLLARRPPADAEFPESILLAVDSTPPAHAATVLTARLAAAHGSRVAIVAGPDRSHAHRRALAEDAGEILLAAGTEPLVLEQQGAPHRAVAGAAAELGASLVVTGCRGLTGVAALRGVSPRIAFAVPCSILIVRPRTDG
jgi:nucleotide-binding universal stress UspA family protein